MRKQNGHDRLEPQPPPKDIHESLAAYLELLDLGDHMLRVGLRHSLGEHGDVDAAYDEWNRRRIETDTQDTIRMLRRLTRSETSDVR